MAEVRDHAVGDVFAIGRIGQVLENLFDREGVNRLDALFENVGFGQVKDFFRFRFRFFRFRWFLFFLFPGRRCC